MKQLAMVFGFALCFLGTSMAEAQEEVGSSVEDICCGGTCCLIGGTCYSTGDENPSNSCESCQPGSNNTGFTRSTVGMCAMDSGGGRTDAGGGGGGGGCQVSGVSSAALPSALALLGFVFMRRRRA